MKTAIIRSALTLTTAAILLPSLPTHAASFVNIRESENGLYQVRFGDKHFTTLHTKGQAKPILYPIIGPHDIRMTRDYPMKKGTPNEASDHPHHQSLWFTHGAVNGVSFWHLGKDTGRIVTTKVEPPQNDGTQASIRLHNKWIDAKDKTHCTDIQTLTFYTPRLERTTEYIALDYDITIHASEGEVVFGDTKEGSMGIRTHPLLRISKGATAINSEGVSGKDIWGKRAKWVDYSGEINEHTVGVAIMDHPSNPRHPTWWHARDYGLVAANAFGVHNFEKKPKGTGDLKLAQGEKVTFRYRFIFHSNNAEKGNIQKRYNEFAEE